MTRSTVGSAAARLASSVRLGPYVGALAMTGVCTAIALLMRGQFDLIVLATMYMLGATISALRLGRGPALLSATANIAAFDFFFVPPRFSLAVSDPHYTATFAVMLLAAVVIAHLAAAVRQQTAAADARERRTAALYAMSDELGTTRDADTAAEVAERHIRDVLPSSARVLVRDAAGQLRTRPIADELQPDMAICRWVIDHRRRAGAGSEPFAGERSIYLPLISGHDVRGVLVICPSDPGRAVLPEHDRLLEALAGQLAAALERVRLAEAAEAARLAAERAALSNTLLASISHDLRTPLAAIVGAGSIVADDGFPLDSHRRTTLGRLIVDKARDMTDFLSNVLELLSIETGAASITRDWHSLADLVGLALGQHEAKLTDWRVFVDVPADVPLLFVDGRSVVRMLSNLVENCTKYTPPETSIFIAARATDDAVIVSVEDDGPGFPVGDPERLFDKFERGCTESNVAGVGLGLAICRATARLNGGEIRAVRVATGGARFEMTFPSNAAVHELLESPS